MGLFGMQADDVTAEVIYSVMVVPMIQELYVVHFCILIFKG